MPSPGYISAFTVDGDFDHDGREDVVIQVEQGTWPSYQNVLKAFSPWQEPTELTSLVTFPNGGETFYSGSIRDIRWLSAVPPSQGESTVELQVSTNGESDPWRTIADNLPNNGCYQWLVDASDSDNCRVKVIVTTSSSSSFDISSSDFTIIGFNVYANGPYLGLVDETIHFIGSVDNGNPPYEYHWDFGDGETSNEQNPTHIFNEEGNFTVIFTVTDDNDITIRDSTWALIIKENNPPDKPNINGPSSGKPGTEYTYNIIASDPDDDTLYVLWDWDDGSSNDWTGPYQSGTEIYNSHIWEIRGTYGVSVSVRDEYGATTSDFLDIAIPRSQISNFIFNSDLITFFINMFPRLKIIFQQIL
jgi:hypothetical protein